MLPILLVYMLLEEALEMITALATPIAGYLLGESVSEVQFPILIALALLIVTSFMVGLGAHSSFGMRFGLWVEGSFLKNCRVTRLSKA